MMSDTPKIIAAGLLFTAGLVGSAHADQVFVDDVIVDGSLCAGMDCVNGESFSFDTIRMKENNLRLHFDDTSNSASFPSNDWRIVANDSSNGGASYLAIEDSSAGRIPFRVEAGAPANSLYVDDGGRIGFGTATPVVEAHIANGDSPTIRLEQNGSSGFTAQTFDIAANEANFFIRDVTNGSSLIFRAKPGAPQNSLFIDSDGDIGMGTESPTASLQVRGSDGTTAVVVEEVSSTTALRNMLTLSNNGDMAIVFTNTAAGAATPEWKAASFNGDFFIGTPTSSGAEFKLSNAGNLTITGSFISGATTLNVPDYVFEDSYELMPLSEVEQFIADNGHLPRIPSAAEINASDGLDMTQMMMSLLEKVEELTLYTLEQEKQIGRLNAQLAD